jgi:cytochrome c peroxidase
MNSIFCSSLLRVAAGIGALSLCLPALALVPPEPFQIAVDGTRQTMEQAGILKATTAGALTSRQWATVLGKAFFWDKQSGSDGQACASCHFHAGADTRLRNQLNPGFNDISMNNGGGDNAFGSSRSDTGAVYPGNLPSGTLADSNVLLKKEDFPLHKLVVEADRNSAIVSTTNDRVGSQGVVDTKFRRVKVLGQNDKCSDLDPTIFHGGTASPANTFAARQTTARNTPTTVNAAFNFRNFWDGRANNMFNGVGVFGIRDINGDPNKRLVVLNGSTPTLGYLKLENASLASQAVGPVTSDIEASCDGRSLADVARKLYLTIPLLGQKIDTTDSVLGPHVSALGKGLKLTNLYPLMIARAFDPKYWSAPGRYKIVNGALVADSKGHTQMELNFPMFWGISIMLYEMSLVSDQSELDTLAATGKLIVNPQFVPVDVTPPNVPKGGCTATGADIDPLLLRGCQIFSRFTILGALGPPPTDGGVRGGNCFVCHNATAGGVGRPTPPMLSQASFQNGESFALMIQVPKVTTGPGSLTNHRHDQGVMSIGVRPAHTDLQNGANDPYGTPLSFSRQYERYLQGTLTLDKLDLALQRAIAGSTSTPLGVAGSITLQPVGAPGGPPAFGPVALGVDSASKVPSLRNVALTPPYFNWGGYSNLRHAMKLYNRGSNRRDIAVNPALERAAGAQCTSGDNSGTGINGDKLPTGSAGQLTLTGFAETACDTNTTATVLPLGLLDCDPDDVTNQVPAACVAQGKTAANDDLAALVRFMKALTDPRVQCDAAPFDHPELPIFNGHKPTDANRDKKADDISFTLPAVGSAGYPKANSYCIPNAGDLFAPGMQSRSGGDTATLP